MDYLSNKPRNPATASVGGAGIQNQAIAERKASQMEIAVEELTGQHARLESLVGELERRIGGVLLPENPAPQPGQVSSPASPLSGKLFEEAARMRVLAERVDSIISRVDL